MNACLAYKSEARPIFVVAGAGKHPASAFLATAGDREFCATKSFSVGAHDRMFFGVNPLGFRSGMIPAPRKYAVSVADDCCHLYDAGRAGEKNFREFARAARGDHFVSLTQSLCSAYMQNRGMYGVMFRTLVGWASH